MLVAPWARVNVRNCDLLESYLRDSKRFELIASRQRRLSFHWGAKTDVESASRRAYESLRIMVSRHREVASDRFRHRGLRSRSGSIRNQPSDECQSLLPLRSIRVPAAAKLFACCGEQRVLTPSSLLAQYIGRPRTAHSPTKIYEEPNKKSRIQTS